MVHGVNKPYKRISIQNQHILPFIAVVYILYLGPIYSPPIVIPWKAGGPLIHITKIPGTIDLYATWLG